MTGHDPLACPWCSPFGLRWCVRAAGKRVHIVPEPCPGPIGGRPRPLLPEPALCGARPVGGWMRTATYDGHKRGENAYCVDCLKAAGSAMRHPLVPA